MDKAQLQSPIDILPAYGILDLKYNRMAPHLFRTKDHARLEKRVRGTDHIIVTIYPFGEDEEVDTTKH